MRKLSRFIPLFFFGIISAFFVSCSSKKISMVNIDAIGIAIGKTEITQDQFIRIMKQNPSVVVGKNLPVGNVSWNDAIYFCNCLSIKEKLEPVYSINGIKNPKDWNYVPCKDQMLYEEIFIDYQASGYRLPTRDEWNYCGAAETNFIYAGSDHLDGIAWISTNSGCVPHEVALKNPNGFGLYDMCGNLWEWTDTEPWRHQRTFKGGSYNTMKMYSRLDSNNISTHPFCRRADMGLRVCKSIK